MIRCTVGVFAHNEGQNVLRTLHALMAQQLDQVEIAEIIVIASGCTDNTVELAESFASSNPIVTVEVETERTGKASAIRRLISMACGDVIVMVGADTLPEPRALERLVQPFADLTVGMTGARVIPLNTPTTWHGFAVQMLWHVHHRLALRKAKLGELVAFRNVIDNFPDNTSTDEPALEALIAAKGYQLVYVPEAIVYNRGPERTAEFVRQRRRVFAGQVRIVMRYGYFTSSLRLRHVLPLAVEAVRSHPQFISWTLAVMAVESWARLLGLWDALRSREEVVWRTIKTSKTVAPAKESVTLISIKWTPGALDPVAFVRELRKHSEPAGSVFWWDSDVGEVLLSVSDGHSPIESLQDRIEGVTRAQTWPYPIARPTAVSCRLVQFPAALTNN
jgi:hypothetical protein